MRTRLKDFSIIPVTALALAVMLPAKAASAQTAVSSDRSSDELAGKLTRREVQRSPISIPGREVVQVETLNSGGCRVRMAYASGRRGRLHHRRPGRDEGAGTCQHAVARGRWFPHPAADPAQCARPRPRNRADAVDLYRRDGSAAFNVRGRTRSAVGRTPAEPHFRWQIYEQHGARRAGPSSASRRDP